MQVRTRRWDEAAAADDGLRILVCRFRPRGLPKQAETWDEWRPELGPSPALLKAFRGAALPWDEFRARYLRELAGRKPALADLARRAHDGPVTLLCSSSCRDAERCHRTLLQAVLERRLSLPEQGEEGAAVARVRRRATPSSRRTSAAGSGTRQMALWFFQRTKPGEIRRITNPSMQRFLAGERGLTHDGDGFVRCIGMSVELHDRKPAQVARVWFSKIRVRDDGRVDPHHRPEVVRLAQADGKAGHEPSVIAAGHRFARRRLSHLAEWRPEERDIEALRAIVNTKAGREMI